MPSSSSKPLQLRTISTSQSWLASACIHITSIKGVQCQVSSLSPILQLQLKDHGGILLREPEFELGQPMAVLRYLDERYPEPNMAPHMPRQRAVFWQTIDNLVSIEKESKRVAMAIDLVGLLAGNQFLTSAQPSILDCLVSGILSVDNLRNHPRAEYAMRGQVPIGGRDSLQRGLELDQMLQERYQDNTV